MDITNLSASTVKLSDSVLCLFVLCFTDFEYQTSVASFLKCAKINGGIVASGHNLDAVPDHSTRPSMRWTLVTLVSSSWLSSLSS